MPLDSQAAAWLEGMLGSPTYSDLGVDEARRVVDEAAADLFGPPDQVAEVDAAGADGVPARIYRPEARDTPVLVWFHGGGWVVGSLRSHDPLCRTLAARSGRTVVNVGYRLGPEHRYPAAVEDAWTATAWAVERFGRVAVGGDSAGGQLAAVIALRARDRGLPLALQVLVVPTTDYSFDRASHRENAEGYGLSVETMRWFWANYLPDWASADDPEVSPLRAPDLGGVCPALVITAEYDPLRDEGELYARRLADAGVPVAHSRYDGQIHGFFRMPGVTDRSNDAIGEVATAVRAALREG
jgi:acetyl esterase